MKCNQMIIFFLIVFTVYFLANGYLYYKGYNVIQAGRARVLYTILFVVLASLFTIGRILERNHSGVITDIINVAGGFWLAYMLYAILLFLISDIVIYLIRLYGNTSPQQIEAALFRRYLAVNLTTFVIVVAGFINALTPVIKSYDIYIDKELDGRDELVIAAVSDLHLGSTIRKRSMKKLQRLISKTDPDIVLFLGDILDGETGPVLRDDLLAYFDCYNCSDGVWGVAGNHEYIGGIENTVPYIESHGITILSDSVVVTSSGVNLIGRKDNDSFRYTGNRRTALEDLTGRADMTAPVILMDHQPLDTDQAAARGVDLMLSGHTHNGQIWPISYLVSAIYEKSYGYYRIDNTHIIVTSGYGLWGPMVRIGSRPEIVRIVLRTKEP